MNVKLIMSKNELVRAVLFQTFASEKMNEGQCSSLCADYDKLVNAGRTPEFSAQIVYSSFGAKEFEYSSLNNWIKNELAKQTRSLNGPEANSLERLRQVISRHNNNLNKLNGVSVDGITLSQDEINSAHINYPNIMRQEKYSSTASVKSKKTANLELTVFRW